VPPRACCHYAQERRAALADFHSFAVWAQSDFINRLMQLVCQRNSLNRHSFTVQEFAELSEILMDQKKDAKAPVSSSAEATR
jgi:hypothetical protein